MGLYGRYGLQVMMGTGMLSLPLAFKHAGLWVSDFCGRFKNYRILADQQIQKLP